MIGRRGFLASLVAFVVAPAAKVPQHGWGLTKEMLEVSVPIYPKLKANVWTVGPPLTEARMLAALDGLYLQKGAWHYPPPPGVWKVSAD